MVKEQKKSAYAAAGVNIDVKMGAVVQLEKNLSFLNTLAGLDQSFLQLRIDFRINVDGLLTFDVCCNLCRQLATCF